MGSKRGREEFSSGEAVKTFFALASVTSSSELCYIWLLPLESPCALALVRPLGVGKETQKDAQDKNQSWKLKSSFLSLLHIFPPLFSWSRTVVCMVGEKSVGLCFSGLISLYGILPLIQVFHRRYSSVWQAKTYKICPKLHFQRHFVPECLLISTTTLLFLLFVLFKV